ncbi:MAG: hypothetical protein ABI663_04815 [Chryseolinea sp.]
MKRALIICFTNLKNDARVMRQIDFLKDQYQLTVAAFDAYPTDQYEFFRIEKTKLTLLRKSVSSVFLLFGFTSIAYKLLHNYEKYVHQLRVKNFQLIIANDIETLPITYQIASTQTKVFFDAHEYAPRQFEDRIYWRIFFKRFNVDLCRKFIPKVDGMSTINGGLAREYETHFGLKPIIITNASKYYNLTPKTLTDYPIKLVHHGIFTISRSPDIMIELLLLLDDRFTLDLIYLLPENASQKTKQYFEEFKQKASQTGKIKILPALKSDQITSTLNAHYDMGIILVPPVNFNYENGLPNKLFDCIQARLAMAVGPLREIAQITNQFNIGVVSHDFTAQGMALALSKLTLEDINRFKENSKEAASRLSADYNKSLLLETLNQII